MKYGFIPATNDEFAQVVQVDNAGLICAHAFVRHDKTTGSYVEEPNGIRFEGQLFDDEESLLSTLVDDPAEAARELDRPINEASLERLRNTLAYRQCQVTIDSSFSSPFRSIPLSASDRNFPRNREDRFWNFRRQYDIPFWSEPGSPWDVLSVNGTVEAVNYGVITTVVHVAIRPQRSSQVFTLIATYRGYVDPAYRYGLPGSLYQVIERWSADGFGPFLREYLNGFEHIASVEMRSEITRHHPELGRYAIASNHIVYQNPEDAVHYAACHPQTPAACKGCRNYFGQTHGGQTLVCGIHPYGPDGSKCSDYEKTEEKDIPF